MSLVALTAALAVVVPASSGRAQVVFPGTEWQSRTPADVGMDAAKLDQIAATIGGSGCIVRNGYMVKTWGSPTLKGDWASASKPVISTMLFFAIEEGRVSGVDSLIRDQGWPLSAKDQTMTFRHLANMVGGYTRNEAPGAAWAYNDYGIQLYVKTLFDRVYGQSFNTVATSPSRLGTLQFQDGSLVGSNNRLNTSARDFARIGWLWANKGSWNGAQLLPQHYFDDYMKPHVPSSLPKTTAIDPSGDYLGIGTLGGGSDQTPYGAGIYGFNWWFNATGALHPTATSWPDAPLDTFQANGHWGKEVVTVMPGLKVVMAYFNGATLGFTPGSSSSSTNQVLKLLKDSVNPTAPLITLDKSQITRVVDFGQSLSGDTFSVSNGGVGTLAYAVAANQSWLTVAPSAGTSAGEPDAIAISYLPGQLPGVGIHQATITVSDNGSSPAASNGSQTIAVTVRVKTVLPDLDADADVDVEDFGRLQLCLMDSSNATIPPGCQAADLNDDSLIDQGDIGVLLSCLSGPNLPADRTCDDSYE